MRLILLLSALLTAMVGTSAPARAAGASAEQVSAVMAVVSVRAAVSNAGLRPANELPKIRAVAAAEVLVAASLPVLPLYAGRLRI